MSQCGIEHPTHRGVLCSIPSHDPHSSHFTVVSWKERYEWPNEAFVDPPKPSTKEGRLEIRGGMLKLAHRVDQGRGHRDGETYDPERDYERLNAQHRRVLEVMGDGGWHTLSEISQRTGDPEASVSARLRDFRKDRFGGYLVERRWVQTEGSVIWEYRVSEKDSSSILSN